MKDLIVGIDLGTTNSEIALNRDGGPHVLSDELGRKILPSVVGITETGELLVGEEARNQYVVHPERTIRSIKRRMGSDTKVTLGAAEYTPQEISAIILKRLKAIAERQLERPVRKAVITVPAYFSDTQRQATREAGEIAGLEVVRIINEQTAASPAQEASQHQGNRILVYDLGGGTFDASIVRIEQGVVEVIASHGDNHLGGDDFDHKIVERVLEHLKIKHGVDVSGQPKAMARILRSAEAAKRHLSDHPYARIEEEYSTEKNVTAVNLALELSRLEYEHMIAPFLAQTLGAVHTALESASLTASQIDEILLVGGATRTPLVRTRLADVFGMEPRGDVDPDLCVAMGAALQGAVLAGDEVSAVLVDITPYTFGTSALSYLDGELNPDRYVPIIKKNSPIPVCKSEAFGTVIDNQTAVEVKIFQGEKTNALENIQIGKFRVEGLGTAPAGNPIIIDLKLDLDGILRVTAKEKKTGLERQIIIDNAIPRYNSSELDDARMRISSLFAQEIDHGSAPAPATNGNRGTVSALDALIAKAKAKLDAVEEEDRSELLGLIGTITHQGESADGAIIEQARKQLS